MLHLIVITAKNNQRYILELQTKNVETHSLLTDYPEVWNEIRDKVTKELQTIVTLNDNVVR